MKLSVFLKVIVSLCFVISGLSAHADFSGNLRLSDGVTRYVEYTSAAPGQPTVVFVNGIVFKVSGWNDLIVPFQAKGFGILRYNFRGQINSLVTEIKEFGIPKFFQTGLKTSDFSSELSEITQLLGIKKFHLVGLSFGASIVSDFIKKYPETVLSLNFISPLIRPQENYTVEGQTFLSNMEALKILWGPLWGPSVYEYQYGVYYRAFWNKRITAERIPKELKAYPAQYKETIFQQFRTVRQFALDEVQFPRSLGLVNFFIANEDKKFHEDQVSTWLKIPKTSQGVLVYMQNSAHSLPETAGVRVGAELLKLITQQSQFAAGSAYLDVDGVFKRYYPQFIDSSIK